MCYLFLLHILKEAFFTLFRMARGKERQNVLHIRNYTYNFYYVLKWTRNKKGKNNNNIKHFALQTHTYKCNKKKTQSCTKVLKKMEQ